MTNRIFRAAGTLAAALVFFTSSALVVGCDSVESGGIAATANDTPNPLPFTNTGGCYVANTSLSNSTGGGPNSNYTSSLTAAGTSPRVRVNVAHTGSAPWYLVIADVFKNGSQIGHIERTQGSYSITQTYAVNPGDIVTVSTSYGFYPGSGGTTTGVVKFSQSGSPYNYPCDGGIGIDNPGQ